MQIMKILLMDLDRLLELLDILCASLSESGLRLAVPLLSLLGRGVYLILPVSDDCPHTARAKITPGRQTWWCK